MVSKIPLLGSGKPDYVAALETTKQGMAAESRCRQAWLNSGLSIRPSDKYATNRFCEYRCQQKAMPVGAVDADHPSIVLDDDARDIVGKCRPDACADVHDRRFTKRGMQRVGRTQKIECRLQRHRAVVLALDDASADDETPLAMRHDIDRLTGMQKPHRPRSA